MAPPQGSRAKPSLLTGTVAGVSAAVFARLCIAPAERLKIRMQVSSDSVPVILSKIWRHEGALGFWRGAGASVARVAPYMGVKFVALEQYKAALKLQLIARKADTPSTMLGTSFVAGSLAGMTAVATTYPFDVLRARMAVVGDAQAPSYASMCRTVVQQNGVRGLYRGLNITLKGIFIHDGCKFGTYDYCKQRIEHLYGCSADNIPFWGRVLSGAFAGLIAQTLAYPTDVLRRRMQTSDGAPRYSGVIQGVTEIYRTEGFFRGVFRGWGVNCFKALPNIAIYMSLYDVLVLRLQALGF
eukprot:EG_transcript_15033